MDDLLVERVLLAVEHVPPGRVVSYGDIAELVGTGPRQVGRIMRNWGGNVAWWRVTNRDGELPGELLPRALPQWHSEGIELKSTGRGCAMARHKADLTALGHAYAQSVSRLV